MSTSLGISREDRLLIVTLNRPEKRNALSFALCRELVDALGEAERDASAGAILLRAEGKAFCAGMDLEEILEPDAAGRAEIHEAVFTFGARLTKPVVAAVQGPALGGGLGVAANAHILVAAEEATFGLTEIRLGLWPFMVFRAVALAVGERRAVELSLTGRIFGAAEAREWGLAHHVVPAGEADRKAREIAAALAASSPGAIRSGLEFVRQTRGLGREEAGEIAREFRTRIFTSADFREGVRAFREKRAPRWPSLG